MDLRELIKSYLPQGLVMQLATVSEGQPWACTLYYVHDDDMNLYWLSMPARRHSREVSKHYQVAAAIVVKYDLPVVGLQVEGAAQMVKDGPTVKRVMDSYITKYGAGKDFYDNYQRGTNKHQLYKLTPKKIVLFDEQNFSGEQARQELTVN